MLCSLAVTGQWCFVVKVPPRKWAVHLDLSRLGDTRQKAKRVQIMGAWRWNKCVFNTYACTNTHACGRVSWGEGLSTQSIRNWSFAQISKLLKQQGSTSNISFWYLMHPEDLTRMGSCLVKSSIFSRVAKGRVVRGMNCPVNAPPLHSLPRSERRKMLVEHYGLGVLVCHLGHMTEDIFFCNNTKEAPRKRKGEKMI